MAPGTVQDRQSTDSLAVDHPDLLKAIEYSREHFCKPIGVADIVDANPRSRRWLEDAFVENLGCTPRTFIFRLRIREAQKLLTDNPDLQPGEVAARCGYSGTRQLNAHFRSELGMTAREFTKADL